MAERVVVHIGLMKSGTTFLQGRLDANREQLAAQGVLFPGPDRRRHANAAADFADAEDRQPGSWESLREQTDDHPGTAVLSMRRLATLGPERIALLAESFPAADLRIVVAVRDLGRTVPAMWQETIKNRQTWTWTEYVESIRTDGEGGRRFWRQQHAGRIVTRWAKALSPGEVYVVTLPPAGASPETLWNRFREVAGIGPASWREAPRGNEPLGAASAMVVRELNLRTLDLSAADHRRRVKALAQALMPQHRRAEDPIGFAVPDWLRQESEDIRAQIRGAGVRVVGDLDELTPLDVPGADPDAVDTAARLEAALAALETTLRHVPRVRPQS